MMLKTLLGKLSPLLPHVLYNESYGCNEIVASPCIGNLLAGHLPAKVRGLVEEWAELHQQELLEMWIWIDFHQVRPLV